MECLLKEKRDRGRPRLYEERMKRKDFYMPVSMINELKQKSEQEKISVNKLVRKMIEYYLINYDKIKLKSKEAKGTINWTRNDSEILLQILNFYVLLDYIPEENFDKIKGYLELYSPDIIESTKKTILKKIVESLKLHKIEDITYYDKLKSEHPEALELFEKIDSIIKNY